MDGSRTGVRSTLVAVHAENFVGKFSDFFDGPTDREYFRNLGADHVFDADHLECGTKRLVTVLLVEELVVLEDAADVAAELRDLPPRRARPSRGPRRAHAPGGDLSRSKSLSSVDFPPTPRPDEERDSALGEVVRVDLTQGDNVALVGLADVLESDHESLMRRYRSESARRQAPGQAAWSLAPSPLAASCR